MDQGSSWLPETTPFCFVFVFPFSRLGEISELFRSVGRRHCRSDEARLVRLGSSKPLAKHKEASQRPARLYLLVFSTRRPYFARGCRHILYGGIAWLYKELCFYVTRPTFSPGSALIFFFFFFFFPDPHKIRVAEIAYVCYHIACLRYAGSA